MKTETLYSRADWKFHKNRLGYDDVIDAQGRLIATVNVADIAAAEMLQPSYLAGGMPKELFVREADGAWSIYLNVPWLTPANVQSALMKLGKLLGRTFVFDPYRLPAKLEARYRREASAMNEGAKSAKPMSAGLSHSVRKASKEKKQHGPSQQRLAALSTQKLKA